MRLQLDYNGPFMGKMFLVNATTKWVEVDMLGKVTSEKTMEKNIYNSWTATKNYKVTDNATVFTSCEMKEFFKRNAIGSVTSATYQCKWIG